MTLSLRLRERLNPNADECIVSLASSLEHDQLVEISAADHGWKASQNLEQLIGITATQTWPSPMPVELKEVLELMQWSGPDSYGWQPGAKSYRRRAFCCAALLRAGGDPENQKSLNWEGENSTIAILLESLDALGNHDHAAAISLFAWRLGTEPNDESPPFLYLAILRNVLKAWPQLEAALTSKLVERLMESEAAEQWADGTYLRDESGDQWLYRTTYFDQTFALWHGFGRDLRQLSADLSDANARQKVLRIADYLDASAA
jgi:hypothetical protein